MAFSVYEKKKSRRKKLRRECVRICVWWKSYGGDITFSKATHTNQKFCFALDLFCCLNSTFSLFICCAVLWAVLCCAVKWCGSSAHTPNKMTNKKNYWVFCHNIQRIVDERKWRLPSARQNSISRALRKRTPRYYFIVEWTGINLD